MIRRPVDDMVDAHFFSKEGATHAPDDFRYLISSKGNRQDIPLTKTCANFNGVNNEVSLPLMATGSGLPLMGGTYGLHIFLINSSPQVLFYNGANPAVQIDPSSQTMTFVVSNIVVNINMNGKSLQLNTWQSIIWQTSPYRVFIDGILAGQSSASSLLDITRLAPTQPIRLYDFIWFRNQTFTYGSQYDFHINIANFNYTGGAVDRQHHFEEGAGIDTYDTGIDIEHSSILGDITNFWYKGADVPYSNANKKGYNIGINNEIIPAINKTTDALGNPLTHKGQVRQRAKVIDVNVGNFDGVSYIEIPHSSDITFGDGLGNDQPFSITGWFNISRLNSSIFGKSGDYQLIIQGDGRVLFSLSTSSNNFIFATNNTQTFHTHLNKWVYIVARYNGSKLRSGLSFDLFDLNGLSIFSNNLANSGQVGIYTGMPGASSNAFIGLRDNGLIARGLYSDIRVHNGVLLASQADSVRKGLLSNQEVCQYSFNEGQGSTVFDLISGNNGIWVLHTDPNQWGKSNQAVDYFLVNNLKINAGGTALETSSSNLFNTGSKIDFNPYLSLGETVPRNYAFGDALNANANMYINQLSRLPSFHDVLIYNQALIAGDEVDRVNNFTNN